MAKNYHEPMHTAEHILNQAMLQFHSKERSFTTHIERKKSKVDYHFDRDLTPEEILNLEGKVNKVISSNLEVTEEFLDIELAKEKFNLQRLPLDAGDKIRIIKVGDYDSCPCIGQHVNNTKEIGKFKIVSTSFNDGVLRMRFKLENEISNK
jgi:misacylated tRNA(Ala) deacylase